MGKVYQILLIEDDESDADLIRIELGHLDIEVHVDVIWRRDDLISRLENNKPDLVISDYNLPSLTGIEALEIIRENHPDLPFILVSGFIGEEKAVDAMLAGASDYAMKNKLDRLGPAIMREIKNYENLKEKQQELTESQNKYKNLLKSVNGIVWEANAETFEFKYVSPQVEKILGYSPSDWYENLSFWEDHIHPNDRKEAIQYCHAKSKEGKDHSFEYRMIDADGEIVWLRDYVTVVTKEGQDDHLHGLMVDITKEKKAEQQRDKAYEIAEIGHWELDLINEELKWSDTVKNLHEVDLDYEPDLDSAINFYKEGKHRQKISSVVEHSIETGEPFDVELKIITAKDNERWIRAVGETECRNGKCLRMYGSTQNITERKETEQKLRDVVEHSTNMFYRHDTDHVLSYVSPQSQEFLGCSPDKAMQRWTEFVTDHPINEEGLKKTQKAIDTGKPQPAFPLELKKTNGEKMWVRVNEAPITEDCNTVAIVGSLTDITEQRELQELLRRTNKLARVGSWEVDFSESEEGDIYWSEMVREILEVEEDYQPTLDEAIDFYAQESKEAVATAVEQAINKGIPFDQELLVKTAKGNKRWVRSIGQAEIVDGECLRIYGSYQDIHDRKTSELELERRNEFIETILENLPIGISVHRMDNGENIWMNEKFSKIYGWPKQAFKNVDAFFEKVYPEEEYRNHIKSRILKDIDSGDPKRMQWNDVRITTKDGLSRYVNATNIPLEPQNQMISTVIDVTSEKEAERKRAETLEQIEDAFFSVDDNWIVEDWNHKAEELLDMPREFIIGKNLWEVYEDAVELDFYTNYHKALKEQVPVHFIDYYPTQDSWFEGRAYPQKEGLHIYFRDVTERVKHQEQIEELALVASKTTDVIIITNEHDEITWVNNAFSKLTGYSFEEAIGENPGNLLQGPKTDQETIQKISNAIRNEKSIQETVLNYSKTGEKYWLDLTIDPIFDDEGNCEGFIAIEKDVTQQIERQRELQESVERYDIVSKATSDTIWDLNLNTDTIRYNQNIYSMFGYKKKEVNEVADWWRERIHPEDRKDVITMIDQALNDDTSRFQLEYRFQCADGSYKYIFDRAFIVKDEEDNPVRMIGAMQDVTAVREERKWLQLFQSAIANTRESVAIIEEEPTELPGRKILYVNEAFTEMTGYSLEEAKGNTLHLLNGPKTSQEKRDKLREAMENWEGCEVEFINYRKNGEQFWIRVSMTPVEGANDSKFWVCIGREITKEKRQQREIKKSLKEKETLLLEIHHRVKNNLAVVSGMMQLQAFDEENQDFKEKLFNSVTRIQTMGNIHELLYQSENFSDLPFHENIEKLTSQVIETMGSNTSIETTFELEKVNLNINQAIPCSLIANEVVTNVLKHAFIEKDKGELQISLSENEEIIYLEINDNGKGIPENIREGHTQQSLGLKLIETLATQLDAEYQYSKIDNGTKFHIEFQKADVKGIGSANFI